VGWGGGRGAVGAGRGGGGAGRSGGGAGRGRGGAGARGRGGAGARGRGGAGARGRGGAGAKGRMQGRWARGARHGARGKRRAASGASSAGHRKQSASARGSPDKGSLSEQARTPPHVGVRTCTGTGVTGHAPARRRSCHSGCEDQAACFPTAKNPHTPIIFLGDAAPLCAFGIREPGSAVCPGARGRSVHLNIPLLSPPWAYAWLVWCCCEWRRITSCCGGAPFLPLNE
jgi:hypothetical protein